MSKERLERGMFKETGEIPMPGKVYTWCPKCYFASGMPFTVNNEYKVIYLTEHNDAPQKLCYHYKGDH